MAELTIRLEIDPTTRKKTLVVDYHSDADALPFEHEEEHERLLEALIGKGIIGAGEAVDVRVERTAQGAAAPERREEEQQPESLEESN